MQAHVFIAKKYLSVEGSVRTIFVQVDVHTNLGDLWRAQGPGGQAEAQRCYAEALKVDARHAPAWRGLGDLMRERAEHASAVACYQACLSNLWTGT